MNTETDPVAPRYITHIGRLALPQPFSGSLWSEPVKIMKDVWLEIKDGQILRIGPEGQPVPPDENDSEAFNADGMMVTPGLIDAHTHPIFVDSRQAEFVRRCRGETYQQIAADGGGIITSIRGVRAADQEKLSGLTQVVDNTTASLMKAQTSLAMFFCSVNTTAAPLRWSQTG